MQGSTRRHMMLGAAALPLAACSTMPAAKPAPFKISLAQWSFHRRLYGSTFGEAMQGRSYEDFVRAHREAPQTVLRGTLDPLDFPVIARREFDIGAVEYVNRFYMAHVNDRAYLTELKHRCESNGVESRLIMCDDEGNLGDPDDARRAQAVENHRKWLEAAQFLGCFAIRVNARSEGSYDEQMRLAADGLHRLAELGDQHGLDVIVENHGGLSSNGQWLASVMRMGDHRRLGTLPDFGNFKLSDTEEYDRYQGVAEMMPFAKAVSAKCYDFDASGNETTLDYPRLMKIVTDAGYHSFLGIEYEGPRMSEADGVRACKALLERIMATGA
ncbi:MAG TPA: sugar phosphate isomerase/epimerase family protein [Caulobacterales bacterium]|nr:sugar phosphate isomerase/epimerase family protein [Caulobacterales bacterium]